MPGIGSAGPPFRADHVGSLLRPAELVEARRRYKSGEIGAAQLREIENQAIESAVRRQQQIGLQSITDGEFRRDYWHIDFLRQLPGVTIAENPGPKFPGSEEQPPIATVTGKVAYGTPIMIEDFAYLKASTSRTAKYTIPSPSMLHLRGGRNAVARDVYPDLSEFWADVANAYRLAIARFATAGCRYLQLDDVSFSYLCDEKVRAACRANGDDPDRLPRVYADTINSALRARPREMTVTMHTCRGNFKSSWVASGGYETVAEAMFSTDVDGFFMEFDSARAGTFDPLRFLPRDKCVVLGLVTTKQGAIEDRDEIMRRIDAAARFVPVDRLCLSPQCGFSSTHHGNALTEAEQWRKLEFIIDVAGRVWRST